MIAKVAFPIEINEEFDYIIPAQEKEITGKRVLVDFRRRRRVGVITQAVENSPYKGKLKSVIKILDNQPSLTAEKLRFANILSRHYLYAKGELIFMMLEESLRRPKKVKLPLSKKRKLKKAASGIILIRGENPQERFFSYKDSIAQVLADGFAAMIIVPYKELIGKILEIVKDNFDCPTFIFHSGNKNNLNNWLKLFENNPCIIITTRLGLFFYPSNLGLLIVEDENNPAYFQPEKPYYNLLDASYLLYKHKPLKLIFSTDFPTMFTYKLVKQKKHNLPVFRRKVNSKAEVFDLSQYKNKRNVFFSPLFKELIRKNLENNKKILIFYNHRHFSYIIKCSACGYVFRCPRCERFLQFSLKDKKGICPVCGYSQNIASVCPKCGKSYIKMKGIGIERLKNILSLDFSAAKVSLAEEAQSDTNIVLGTQKIFNIFHKPLFDVSFALGVDYIFSRIDYETSFLSYMFLEKLRSLTKDKMYIFTHNPGHYVFRAIKAGEENLFYQKEEYLRKKLSFFPYGHIAKIIVRSRRENTAFKKSGELFSSLENKVTAYGPFKESPYKLRGYYYYSIIIKQKDGRLLREKITQSLHGFKKSSAKVAFIIR